MDLKLAPADRPSFSPERCINRRQRRVVCRRCADICPRGVFSLERGSGLRWDHCTDCGLCVANCPSRCFTPSGQDVTSAKNGWADAIRRTIKS